MKKTFLPPGKREPSELKDDRQPQRHGDTEKTMTNRIILFHHRGEGYIPAFSLAFQLCASVSLWLTAFSRLKHFATERGYFPVVLLCPVVTLSTSVHNQLVLSSSLMVTHNCHSRKRSASGILLKTKNDSGQAGMTENNTL